MNLNDRIKRLMQWDVEYHTNDEPSVTNVVYDAERDAVKKLAPKDPYFTKVGAPLKKSAWPKHRHEVPMGSFDKVTNEKEFLSWYTKIGKPELSWSDKGDGISISIRVVNGTVVRAVTRGEDGIEGEDITPNVIQMEGVPKKAGELTAHVRAEIVLRKSLFEEHFKPLGYKNCRNGAGGAAKDFTGARCRFLTVLAYELLPDGEVLASKDHEYKALKQVGFIAPSQGLVSSAKEVLQVYREYIAARRGALDYVIDGLVLQVNDTALRESFGGEKLPEGARAFKFPADEAETTLRSMPWQVGASGRITPVAYFDPIELAGASVKQATLHNVANIGRVAAFCGREWLAIGDTILVSRRGDVIPQVEALVRKGDGYDINAPIICPSCAAATEMDGEYLICPNKNNCEAQTAGSIKRWVAKLGIKEVGGALIEALCEAGLVSEPADLYTLKIDDVATLQYSGRRVGELTAKTALDNLHARKELPLHVLVGSLGIPLWARSMCKVLVEAGYDSIFKMQDATLGELVRIPGVEVTKAQAFIDGLREALPKIHALLKAGIIITPEATGSMKGLSVCLTGFRNAELDAAVEAAGGTMKPGVSKTLTYLVAKNPNESGGKLDKARSYGTKIVGIEEMWKILGGRDA